MAKSTFHIYEALISSFLLYWTKLNTIIIIKNVGPLVIGTYIVMYLFALILDMNTKYSIYFNRNLIMVIFIRYIIG